MVNKLKVAHVTATFPPYQAGTGNVCFHNARELVRLGHEVHVFTAVQPQAPAQEMLEGIQVHRLRPLLRYGNAPFLPTLFTHLRYFDLVHLHMPFFGGSEAIYVLRKIYKVPLVITYHQDVQLNGVAGLISRIHDRIIGRGLMQSADRACFTSLDYAHASSYKPLIAKNKLRLAELPNGVDTQRFTPGAKPATLVSRYGTDDCRVILFVGGLDRAHYFKGIPVLLQALTHLQAQSVKLIVVGKGDMLAAYRQQARDLSIDHCVQFAGFVSEAELADHYRLADVTVLPSTTMGEAFGLVLLESLACGTPVIASDLPGVRTVVKPDEDGYLVRPGDALEFAAKIDQLLAMPPEQRNKMGQAGRRQVLSTYAWPQIGRQLEALYMQVAANTKLVGLPDTKAGLRS